MGRNACGKIEGEDRGRQGETSEWDAGLTSGKGKGEGKDSDFREALGKSQHGWLRASLEESHVGRSAQELAGTAWGGHSPTWRLEAVPDFSLSSRCPPEGSTDGLTPTIPHWLISRSSAQHCAFCSTESRDGTGDLEHSFHIQEVSYHQYISYLLISWE